MYNDGKVRNKTRRNRGNFLLYLHNTQHIEGIKGCSPDEMLLFAHFARHINGKEMNNDNLQFRCRMQRNDIISYPSSDSIAEVNLSKGNENISFYVEHVYRKPYICVQCTNHNFQTTIEGKSDIFLRFAVLPVLSASGRSASVRPFVCRLPRPPPWRNRTSQSRSVAITGVDFHLQLSVYDLNAGHRMRRTSPPQPCAAAAAARAGMRPRRTPPRSPRIRRAARRRQETIDGPRRLRRAISRGGPASGPAVRNFPAAAGALVVEIRSVPKRAILARRGCSE